jgi:hypothetical protein
VEGSVVMPKHLTYTVSCYKKRRCISVLEADIDEQTRRCEDFRVDLDDSVRDGLLLVRADGTDMLNFVERHLESHLSLADLGYWKVE